MLVSDFDYDLPERLIAQEPDARRDQSRLLVVDRALNKFSDSSFERLTTHLRAGDVVVLNNTRVFPARLIGWRARNVLGGSPQGGGRVEIFLIRRIEPLLWEALVRPGRSLRIGARVHFDHPGFAAEVVEWREGGRRVIQFEGADDFDSVVDAIGRTPLPPYIKRDVKRDGEHRLDSERYQTVYARERGAVAAPTAGLHFTQDLLERLREGGIEIVELTLHVGYGTFQPVRVDRVEDHRVEPETYSISEKAALAINRALADRRRIIAVGTTTTRALESAHRTGLRPGRAATDLFIYPGFAFRVLGGLITNFHLPLSSLLMLVSAFAGRELVLQAYAHAVRQEYRFYSFGDAMLIL